MKTAIDIAWIRLELDRRDLSIPEYATLCGIDRSHLNKILNGTPEPLAGVVTKLADGLGCPADYILGRRPS